MFRFVSYVDVESCEQAVQTLNNFVAKGSTLRVDYAPVGEHWREENRMIFSFGFRLAWEFSIDYKMTRKCSIFSCLIDGLFDSRSLSSSVNLVEKNSSSPSQSNHFRSASERPIKLTSSHSTDESTSKSLSPNIPVIDIDDHDPLVAKKTYHIYLSNIQVPNVVFVATLDDYVNAALLMTQMNKHEQLTKVKGNSYKSK